MIKHGLCCISIELQNQKIKAQTMRYKIFSTIPESIAYQLIHDRTLNNLNVILAHLQLCQQRGWNYRIGSDIVPLATHPLVREQDKSFYWPRSHKIDNAVKEIKDFIELNNIRCSMHPDQFVVPASANPKVVKQSIADLEFHAYVMDLFGLPRTYEAPINIHLNCYKGDTKEIANRFISIFLIFSPGVRKRLVLENEDKKNSWSVQELYDAFYNTLQIPITYDSLHHRLNSKNLTAKKACDLAYKTWSGVKPLFHFSNGKTNDLDRSHADYVYTIHSELFNNEVDIDFEFKMKDLAIQKYERNE